MLGWLFTIEDRQGDPALRPGEGFEVWTDPPRLSATGAIRRRADGDPYTPAWDQGDRVVVFHPDSDRCWALLTIDGPAVWNKNKERFFTEMTFDAVDRHGPRLKDIGVDKALQGGRHRLTNDQLVAALKRFGLG